MKNLTLYPIRKLECRIKNKILKNNFSKMTLCILRDALHQWENQAQKKFNPTVIFNFI